MTPEGRLDWDKAKQRISWKKDYSVGIKGIDGQHKMMVDIINAFAAAVQRNEGSSKIESTLEDLIEYTKFHFATEEVLMGAVGYPFLTDHKRKHKTLIDQINGFQQRVLARDYISNQEVLAFLYDWLITHILTEDKKCMDLYRSKGLQ
jgi:hemerythrin-like metal-binding protein